MSTRLVGPIQQFLLERSRARLNQINWSTRKSRTLRWGYRVIPPAPVNPDGTRNEIYDMFYRIPREGRGRERRPGVDETRGIRNLPMYEEPGVPSFFYREGVSSSVRKKTGVMGVVKANVPLPIGHTRSTINANAAKTVSPMQRGRKFPSGPTDQKPIIRGRRSWDGVVRNVGRRPDWKTAKSDGKAPPKSLRNDPFDFSQ